MVIVLFHVLYLVGKFVYQNYRSNKQKDVNDDTLKAGKEFTLSERDNNMINPDAPHDFEEQSIKFFPPAYVQRYTAVIDVLNNTNYQGKLRKIVDFGCAELGFLVYLKNTAAVEEILCVDIDRSLLDAYKDKAAPLVSEYLHTRTTPLTIEICEGSVIHNDKKLENMDAVICIELIEHLYPETLTDLPYNIFGYIKPKLVVITTPNADFNVLFPNFSGFRHYDHKFEWTRQQFQDWAENITLRYPEYIVTFDGIGKGPESTEHLGCCSQMAVFHRINEKETYSRGIEGLFKTVAKHEYPFRVDNRSDEEKILDEATYYIRQLSFQNCEMEEEVPLKNILGMLSSFCISIDGLRVILEEANWTVENRELGPVVLVPPISTFSDYSTVEDALWNDDVATDEDDWNREPGPPENSSRFFEQDSVESWDNQTWDQEPSIVIPVNNSILEDNTYLFHEANLSSENISDTTRDTENFERRTENSSKENLDPIPSIDDVSDSFRDNIPSYLSESTDFSDSSLARKFEDVKSSSLDVTLSSTVSSSVQKLNRTLDLPTYVSVSRASTSPEPYLLQTVKMDQHLHNNSMCNQSMSNHWMLNNSSEQINISIDTTVGITDGECKVLLKSNFDDHSHLHSMYLNMSYNETEDSAVEHLSSNTSASTSNCNQTEMQSVQDNRNWKDDLQLQVQLQSNDNKCFAGSVLKEDAPQFTSSPKIETKLNIIGNKRRSLDYKEQKNNSCLRNITEEYKQTSSNNNNCLESSNEAPMQSYTDTNISTTPTIYLSTVTKLHDRQSNSMDQNEMETNSRDELINNSNDNTLTRSDTSTIASTLLIDDEETAKELPETNFLSDDDDSLKKTGKAKICSENIASEQTEFTSNTHDIQSLNCDTTVCLTDQQLHVKSDPLVQFVCDKTEPKPEVHVACDLESVRNVNSTEMSCSRAKDISNLESISLVSNFRIKDARDVQFSSVLKSEKQLECNMAESSGESKCKNINPSVVEVAESVELKPCSPEMAETPPNSWSPEVMDSGYPNSASAQDMTPEYDLSSIAQDHISDSESPSIAEAPRLGVLDVIEVENGDLVNNNRDGEGNNMMAAEINELEDLQPLIDVLENDLENENDIYVLENGFPMWLLRILNMANPIDVGIQVQDHRELRFPNRAAADDGEYANMERDEGFDSSSEENSDLENNALMNNVENDNENASNSGSGQWVVGDT